LTVEAVIEKHHTSWLIRIKKRGKQMSLFPIHESTITLPDLEIKTKRIGNNKVIRYGFKSLRVEASIFESGRNGLYSIRTPLPGPYEHIYLRQPRRRPIIPPNSLCLEFFRTCNVNAIDERTRFKWYQHPLIDDHSSPEKICQGWGGQFQFKEDKPELNQPGLRMPQLGALHAISAYFSVDRDLEPATVVLPTGTGKTETMLSVLIYRQLQRLLVIVPSSPLRDQISQKFMFLGYLPILGLTPYDVALPNVAVIKKSIKSLEEVDQLLAHANVIVATVSILKSSDQNAVDRLCKGCSDLFVDEAHHISATTWSSVRERFVNRRIVQFTATPFRNDGKDLGGHIIYNYTMGEAQRAGYFRHINLSPVEEYYLGEGDRAIAEEAVAVLRKDLNNDHDHLLMARVEEKSRVKDILPIYQQIAPDLNPIVVHSGLRKTEVNSALSSLFARQTRIVICVNMLGEGFDLPQLKVAAIHDHHKSLAITLQFIGRFTRQAENVGDASVIVNIAEPEIETGLQKLYDQSADWDSVLRRLAETRIKREIRLQEVVERLKEKGNLHNQLSLWNLRPSCSAILFKTNCENWTPEAFKDVLPNCDEHWYSVSEKEKLLVILAIHHSPVKWRNYRDLKDIVYKLLIAHWDQSRSGLFVYSNDYQWFRSEKLAEAVCNGSCKLLSGPKVFNIFNGVEYPLVRNLGASKIGAISFTQYFGPNVTEGLSSIEASESNLSNLAGIGYEEGERVIWGCSQKKGKVWSVSSGSIAEWGDWVKRAWDKVVNGNVDEANITRDFLRPKRIDEPYNEHPVSVQWGEHTLAEPEDRVLVLFGDTEVPLYLIDLHMVGQQQDGSYHIIIRADELESIYALRIDKELPGGFEYQLHQGKAVSIQRGRGTPRPLEEYLVIDPWIIQYVDGSYSYNSYLIKVTQTIGQFDAEQIDIWNWTGIDITKESMGRDRKINTVQYRTFEMLEDQYDVIFNDDDPGEAADLVGFKVLNDQIVLCLVHCKYSGGDSPGSRIRDLYEVCGQAQKSIRWKHAGISRLVEHLRKRESLWKEFEYSRFLKGTIRNLINIKRLSRTFQVKFLIYIIQPGLKKSNASAEMLRVLGSTALYLKNTSQGDLSVVGSE
jgi:superfamily II DNA or RNA helicase